MPNHSTILGHSSVIYLGHTSKEPLMWPGSELVDGLEPHGLILQWRQPRAYPATCTRVREGVPGVVGLGGYWEGGIPGTQPGPRLRLIYGIFKI